MKFTTFAYYTGTYYGEMVDEIAFPKWLSRATDKLNYLTNNRIDETVLDFWEDEIAKATCVLIDLLFQIDQATVKAQATDETNVKSLSSGGESITYNISNTLITSVLTDINAQNKLCYDQVRQYLGRTGLLYMGV